MAQTISGATGSRHIPRDVMYRGLSSSQIAPKNKFTKESAVLSGLRAAYQQDKLGSHGSTIHQFAVRLGTAMEASLDGIPTLAALRVNLGYPEDGKDDAAMLKRLEGFARVVFAAGELVRWIRGV